MKRISIQRMLAATAVLLALAGCKDEYDNTKPSVKEPAVLAIQNASNEAEVVSLLEPKNRTIDLRAVANSISDENVTRPRLTTSRRRRCSSRATTRYPRRRRSRC